MSAARMRSHLERLTGYTPGEQLHGRDVIKLNTNESPYPPSPRVAEALRAFDAAGLRRYPDATAMPVREAVARRFDCPVDRVFVGNGSDEVLALLTRLFLGPGDRMATLDPSYSLYPVLAAIQDARIEAHPLDPGFAAPASIRSTDAPLVLIANPNAPTGLAEPPETVAAIAAGAAGLVVVDEAYADFAQTDCAALATGHDRLAVVRTLSKSYGLAGLRVGCLVGPEWLVERLLAIKDSYNVDALAQAVAVAAVEDDAYLSETVGRIRATRDRVAAALVARGWDVVPSSANFVLARPAKIDAGELCRRLRDRRILVRHFDAPRIRDRVRVSIGSDEEMDRFLQAAEEVES